MRLRSFKMWINRFIFVIIPIIVIASPPKDKFTAKIIQRANGQQTTGKVYVEDSKYRIDITTEEEISILVDIKTDERYIISHSKKTAREIQKTVFQSLYINPFESALHAIKHYNLQEQGFDTIDGLRCKEIQIYDKKGEKIMIVWLSNELHWPVKIKTEDESSIEAELTNIKKESFNNSLFSIPEGYKITSSFDGKKKTETEKKEDKTADKELPPVIAKPVDIKAMKESIILKLEKHNIKQETNEGQIKIETVTIPVLEKFFPKWIFFRITREKQIQEETLFSYIPVEKAAVSKDDETVCIISSPATDMPLKSALTIVQNEDIKLKDTEELREFASALDAIYFKDSKIQGVDSLGNNKWAIYTGTFFEYLTGFLVKADSSGKVIDIKYSLKIKKK